MSESTGLPPIYADAPVNLVPHSVVASFPVNTFLENITVAADGTLFISNHEAGEIVRMSPGGEPSVFARFDGKVTGIAFAPDNELILTGWDQAGASVIIGVTADGTVTTRATLPEAQFLNGITPLSADHYLAADSYRGLLWRFDRTNNKVDIWLEHPLLARSDTSNPFPAANGVKIFGDTLYVSNTQRALLVKVPLNADNTPGEPTVFVEPTNLDDFAFDQAGNLYATTHVYNSVVKIAPDSSTTIIAGADQMVVGSTSVAFGQQPDDQTSLYVVTNGGMSFPPPGGVMPANVVRLEIGQSGYPMHRG